MRVAAYARFSSDLQRDTSLDDQLRVCREYAERQGWTWQADQAYTDAAISGSSIEGRAGLQAVLVAAAARPRPFDVLLVDDSSRVARDLADALRTVQQLRFAGVRVVYISQSIDSASEQHETLIAVHGLIDGVYLREMATKIRRGLAGQFDRGYSTGAVRYGYRAVPVPDPSGKTDPATGYPALIGKRLEVDDAEAAIIRRIFELCATGNGVGSIVRALNTEGAKWRDGKPWRAGAVRGVLSNERLIGRLTWGRRRFERRPGTRQKVARETPREEWRTQQREDLRIVSDELWAAAQARRQANAAATRQPGRTLMKGRNAALHSPYLFSGFMRCGVCGASISVVCGGHGSPRYGCRNHSKNGDSACTNRLTVRAKIADAAMVAGLQAELLRPETIAYVSDQLAAAMNEMIDQRPKQRADVEQAIETACQKLQHLIVAVEAGAGAPTVFKAIKDREAEIGALQRQLESLAEPVEQRLAIIPTWVKQQLQDAASLLAEVPERAKAEFRRLGIGFTVRPVYDEGDRPFLRAEGTGDYEHLTFTQYAHFTTSGANLPRSAR